MMREVAIGLIYAVNSSNLCSDIAAAASSKPILPGVEILMLESCRPKSMQDNGLQRLP
jgi:hypothetical protein